MEDLWRQIRTFQRQVREKLVRPFPFLSCNLAGQCDGLRVILRQAAELEGRAMPQRMSAWSEAFQLKPFPPGNSVPKSFARRSTTFVPHSRGEARREVLPYGPVELEVSRLRVRAARSYA